MNASPTGAAAKTASKTASDSCASRRDGFCRTVEPRVVDGDRGAARKVLRGCEIGLRVASAALRGNEGDCSERAVTRDERHAHRRTQPELLEYVLQLWSLGGCLSQQLLGDLREQLGLPRANDVGHAVRGVWVGRILLRELVGPANLLRIDVRDGQALDRPVRGDHVDRAPVGEAGNGKPGEVRECRLVVER